MIRMALAIIALCLITLPCDGQYLTVTDAAALEITQTVKTLRIKGTKLAAQSDSQRSEPADVPVKLLEVSPAAKSFTIRFEDQNRNDVSNRFLKLDQRHWMVSESGRYWVQVHTVDFDEQKIDQQTIQFEIENGPPKPDIEPDDKPDQDPPIDAEGLRVAIIHESADLPKLPTGQQSVFFSEVVREYLNENCFKVNGHPEFRIFDQHVPPSKCDSVWCQVLSRPRSSLPWLVISNGKRGYEGPLPGSVIEMLDLLKSFK